MDSYTARENILDRALEIDSEQFEQLCKMLIERAEQTHDLELTPFRGDGGIDVHAVIDRDLFHARLGVQAKQYSPGNTVGPRTVQSFKGALNDQEYHIGTVITTSSFTDGAIESAERDYIRMIDGGALADIMLDSQIGVLETSDGTYEVDHEFWNVFEKPEDSDTIPSLEVPQADNFDVVRIVLQAIDNGYEIKPAITEYLERETGDEWDPRQADYYGIAGWLLGFLHKEQYVHVDNGKVRRWGLTREGEEYIKLLDEGNRQTMKKRLNEAIYNVEIVSRIFTKLEAEKTLERKDIANIIAEETTLSGTTTGRRARTVGKWLVELPGVRTSGSGPTQKYEFMSRNLSDFN